MKNDFVYGVQSCNTTHNSECKITFEVSPYFDSFINHQRKTTKPILLHMQSHFILWFLCANANFLSYCVVKKLYFLGQAQRNWDVLERRAEGGGGTKQNEEEYKRKQGTG